MRLFFYKKIDLSLLIFLRNKSAKELAITNHNTKGQIKMKNSFNARLLSRFYHSAVSAEMKKRGFSNDVIRKVAVEHKAIISRAKDIGKSRLLSSYIMAVYFIALNRGTGRPAENFVKKL